MAIQSFSDKDTEYLYGNGRVKKGVKWADIVQIALRKLDMLNYSTQLIDLKAPPGNRLESLSGDLKGFFSIRINDQWRIIFKWTNAGPSDVRITDYH